MENENNIKGVGLKALFTEYVKSDVPSTQPASELNEVFGRIWAKLDRKEKDITKGGGKRSPKRKNKGIQGIQMKQTPTVEKNVSSKEIEDEELTK